MLVAGAHDVQHGSPGGQAKWPDAEEAIGRRSSSAALELWGESPGRGRAASASPSVSGEVFDVTDWLWACRPTC